MFLLKWMEEDVLIFKTQNRVSIMTDGVYWIATHPKKELGFKPNWYYDCFFRQKVFFFLVNEKTKQKRKNRKNVTEGDDIAYDETSTFGEKSHLGFIFLFWRIGLVMSLCFRLHLWVLLYLHMTKHFLISFRQITSQNKVQSTRKSPTKHQTEHEMKWSKLAYFQFRSLLSSLYKWFQRTKE